MLIVGILVKCTSKGKMIYVSQRVGKNGKTFNFYKFRSMHEDAEKELESLLDQNETDGITFKMENDPRITKFGKFIRKTSFKSKTIIKCKKFYIILEIFLIEISIENMKI